MSQFTVYKSTDASAPVLTGQTGALTALLTAILVNGYGAKAAAGWTNPLHGAAGQEVYKQGAGSQFYLQVDDTGPGTGTFKEARSFGWETMSAWNTGTGEFPLPATLATGITIRKSNTADGTARVWIAFADARTLYLFVADGSTASQYTCYMFGDFYTTASGDAYNCAIIGRNADSNAALTTANENFGNLTSSTSNTWGVLVGHYIARPYTAVAGTPATAGKTSDCASQVLGIIASTLTFPNTADGGIYLAPVRIHDNSPGATTGVIRGRLRGIYQFFHAATNVNDGDTFTGTGDYAGKTFQVVKSTNGAIASGMFVMETSNTLETN